MEPHRGQLIQSDIYDQYDDETFYSSFASAFTYPFREGGWKILAAGVGFFFLASFLSFIPLVSIVVAAFTAGYLASYMMRVIISSSDGAESLPNWPEFADFFEDIIAPMFRWGLVFFMCFAPAVGLLFSGLGKAAVVAAIAGLIYLPMGLIAASLHENVFAANPLVVIPAILKVPIQYMLTLVVLGLVAGTSALAQYAVGSEFGLLSGAVTIAISLYFATVQCRIMGLLYYFNDETLNWFSEADRFYR